MPSHWCLCTSCYSENYQLRCPHWRNRYSYTTCKRHHYDYGSPFYDDSIGRLGRFCVCDKSPADAQATLQAYVLHTLGLAVVRDGEHRAKPCCFTGPALLHRTPAPTRSST